MAITAAMVKELREMTGAGMMDCKKALVETEGNLSLLNTLFRMSGDVKSVSDYMIGGKASRMLEVCDAMVAEKNPLDIKLPAHIAEVIEALS